jgi:hypothetical protein
MLVNTSFGVQTSQVSQFCVPLLKFSNICNLLENIYFKIKSLTTTGIFVADLNPGRDPLATIARFLL